MYGNNFAQFNSRRCSLSDIVECHKYCTDYTELPSPPRLAVPAVLREDTLMVRDLVPADVSHAAQALLEGLGQLIRRYTGERRKAEHLYDDLANLSWALSGPIV